MSGERKRVRIMKQIYQIILGDQTKYAVTTPSGERYFFATPESVQDFLGRRQAVSISRREGGYEIIWSEVKRWDDRIKPGVKIVFPSGSVGIVKRGRTICTRCERATNLYIKVLTRGGDILHICPTCLGLESQIPRLAEQIVGWK
jgi:hypothetical protein